VVERRNIDAVRGKETGTDRREIWRGVREAHSKIRGEHQIAEYVEAL
jgi:hypothetical protein